MKARTRSRSIPAAVLAAAALAASCIGDAEPAPGAPADAPTIAEMAEEVGADVVRLLAHGYYPGRSGDIVLVTRPWSVMGTWGERIRGPDDPRTSHAVPWDYLTRVPIVLHGPGHVPAGLRVDRPVDLADLAPTLAELMGFDFDAPDGRPLREALAEPDGDPPAVIVVFVHDGGGWNVLEQWPDAWPSGRRLSAAGTVYANATVGSAPPITTPVHATIGTGAYPRTHGLPEIVGRLPDGSIGELYRDRADPGLLRSETVADAWDRANANRPWVGLVGFEPWHLGMMGKGAAAEGGDRDLAVLWDRDEARFFGNEELYEFPDYLPGEEAIAAHLDELDASDGARDGAWRGHDLADPHVVGAVPAFPALVGDVLREIVRREPLGDDELTDLLFVNIKATDEGGHRYNMLGEEMEATLAAQDAVVGDLAAQLDEEVGPGEWVLVLTADHGQTPIPSTTGGMRVDKAKVAERVNGYFGREIVENTSPDDLYLFADVIREAGISMEAVARFVATLRYRDVAPDGTDLASLPEAERNRRVFAGAFPGAFLAGLTEPEIASFGEGAYPEGDLTSPRAMR